MKRIIKFIIICIFTFIIAFNTTSCNYQLMDLNYNYSYAYLTINDRYIEYKIKSWKDYTDSDMIQFTTEEDLVILTFSANVILSDKQLKI